MERRTETQIVTIRTQIAAGSYSVPAHDVAEAILPWLLSGTQTRRTPEDRGPGSRSPAA